MTNVQMAFMMIIRVAVRCPIMLICAWVLTFKINPQLAMIFLVVSLSWRLAFFDHAGSASPV